MASEKAAGEIVLNEVRTQIHHKDWTGAGNENWPDSVLIGTLQRCALFGWLGVVAYLEHKPEGPHLCGLRVYVSGDFDGVHVFRKES